MRKTHGRLLPQSSIGVMSYARLWTVPQYYVRQLIVESGKKNGRGSEQERRSDHEDDNRGHQVIRHQELWDTAMIMLTLLVGSTRMRKAVDITHQQIITSLDRLKHEIHNPTLRSR